MGRKSGKFKKKESGGPKKRSIHEEDGDMMNDEIDAFHKQRDIIPLDLNEDAEESDEDNELPVFNLENDKDEDKDEEDDDDDNDIEDDTQYTGFAAKIARQQKYLRAKMGGVEDEMDDEAEDQEEKRSVWGRNKNLYYNAENIDYELQSSDEEDPAEEEREVLRLQKEKALSMTAADFGHEDVSEHESDGEPTIGELVNGKLVLKTSSSKEAKDDPVTAYEEVKKDLNSLTTEEQMDIVYSSAPELVGLLSELNDAFEQLEDKVNPVLIKIGEKENVKKEVKQYMEVKQLLLLAYCQAITFYLLLKSEGQVVRDHPVISRLVEIKNLLEKMKELDVNLPPKFEDILNENKSDERVEMQMEEHNVIKSCSFREPCVESVEKTEMQKVEKTLEAFELAEDDSLKANKSKFKHQEKQVGMQSLEMLKVRAALEEKLKKKGVFSSIKKHDETKKRPLPLNGQLETWDDFDDDAREDGSLLLPNKLSRLVTSQTNKAKSTAGDDDLPKRDDIGERRRKFELRVLAGAGVKSVDDVEDEAEAEAVPSDGVANEDLDAESDSDLEFYKQVEQEHAAKLTAKAEMYSRPAKVPAMPETLADGKRQITYQMEKNRGLTRSRNKLTKNPRKKYRTKHQKAVVRRKGQVRDIKKPTGPYGGESSGINTGISRSVRFKN